MKALRVGLAGAGHIAGAHLAAWRRTEGFRLHGVFDLDRAAAERRARAYGADRVFDDLESLIGACDVIDVLTPPATHAEIAGRVLSAQRHLLIEKPLVTRAAEWESLRRLLENSPARLAVVHNLKFTRGIRRAERWLRNGRIGRLLRLDRLFLTDAESDRMLAGRHWSHGLPGGRWFETLPHELYLIHFFAGPLALRQVTALSSPRAPAGARADEVLVSFAGGGCHATVHYSAHCRLNRRELRLYGTEGVITVDVLSDAALLERHRDRRWQRTLGGLLPIGRRLASWPGDRAGYLVSRLRRETPHAALIRQFGRHILAGDPSPTPLDEIDYVIRQGEAIATEIDAQLASDQA